MDIRFAGETRARRGSLACRVAPYPHLARSAKSAKEPYSATAVPAALPSPLPKWAKTLLRLQSFFVPGYATDLVQYEGLIGNVLADSSNQWRRFVWSFAPTGSTDTADIAYTTFDIVNITGGLVDNSWTAGDYTTVENAMTPLLTYYSSSILAVNTHYTGMKAYRMAFTELPTVSPTPPDRDHPFAPTGPPDHVLVGNTPGTQAGNAAPQMSFSTTDKTAYPRHWGRNYWPFPSPTTTIGADLQVPATIVDGMATALHTFYDTLMGAEFFPVVPVTQMNKAPARALLTVSSIQVDSNMDVIRRRRAHVTRYRKNL